MTPPHQNYAGPSRPNREKPLLSLRSFRIDFERSKGSGEPPHEVVSRETGAAGVSRETVPRTASQKPEEAPSGRRKNTAGAAGGLAPAHHPDNEEVPTGTPVGTLILWR